MNTSTIVTTTLEIQRMNARNAQDILIKLLISNPTVVLRAMGHVVPVKKKKSECFVHESQPELFKIVIEKFNDLIPSIKFIRERFGCGLRDSKDYVEGANKVPIQNQLLDNGVLCELLTREQADAFLRTFERDARTTMNFAILPQNEPYVFKPYVYKSR